MSKCTAALVALAFVVAIGVDVVSGINKMERVLKRENKQQRVYTASWAVEILEGGREMADMIASRYGFNNLGKVGGLSNVYHFELRGWEKLRVRSGTPYTTKSRGILSEPSVGFVEQQVIRPRSLRSYYVPSDPLFPSQWQLLNTGQQGDDYVGNDLNVEKAWLQGLTGCNVTVTIVDDGLDFTHQDLLDNFAPQISYNFVADNHDPSSGFPWHGTACGGIVGALQENQTCGVGIAHKVNLGGIALLGSNDDIAEARSLTLRNDIVDIYSNSWGPSDSGEVVDGPEPVTKLALKYGTQEGRGGKGSIFVWANGNGGRFDDCAADGYTSSIYTISVGAIGVDGTPSGFDEECSAKMVVTYVTDKYRTSSVSTTDLFGSCRTDFGGTSAAAPLASGAIALALEANKNLTWRDVQYLLVYTSNPQLTNATMFTLNGAGLVVSRQFGFGVLDAEALVTRARHWINVPPQMEDEISSTIDFGLAGFIEPFTDTMNYSGSIHFLEHVVVRMTLEVGVGRRGDIQVELTSPSGTISTILGYRRYDYYSGGDFSSGDDSGDDSGDVSGDFSGDYSGDDSSGYDDMLPDDYFDFFGGGDYENWPFMSVMFWGEDPTGQWELTVYSKSNYTEVFVSDIEFTFFGVSSTPEAVANIPDACHSDCIRGCAKGGSNYCDACVNLRNAYTLECIDACPPGYSERNGYCYNPDLLVEECNSPLKSKQTGSCVDAGFVGCCTDDNCRTEETIPFFSCFCDAICYKFGDCCDDISLISCTPENTTEAATAIPYIDLGVTAGVETNTVPSFDDYFSEPINVQFPLGYQLQSTVYVGTNGYFTFEEFGGFIPFIFNDNVSLSLVAPFFTDIDISGGIGQIIYEVHTLSTSKHLLSKIDSVVNEQTNANFKGKWMLVATWEDVPQFGTDYNITSTFQGILTTNFEKSYAVFIYRCGDLNFPLNRATIGFVTEDGLYDVHEATFRRNISAIACLNYPNSPWVNVVYDIAVPGSCADAGFTSCCTDENCQAVPTSPHSCFCDALCYTYDDCCDDIASIDCYRDDITPRPPTMPYIELGQQEGVVTQSVPISLDGLSPPIYVDFPYGEQLQSKVYVGTNGYFTFEYYIEYIPFVFDEIRNISLVAPFFTDIDVRHGIGQISYEIHTNSTSNELLSKINSLIKQYAKTNFQGKWMLVATWDDVPQYGGDYDNIRNTFQGMLVTDFARSFAVFTYHCGDLEFSSHASIGFVTEGGLFANHEAVFRSNTKAIACENVPTSPWVNVVYEVTLSENECEVDNGGCEDICTDTFTSYECSCRDGYFLTPDGFTCSNETLCDKNNGGCDHICTATPISFECSCMDGYSLDINGYTCNDINECLSPDHGCEHNCVNNNGSYTCECREGYALAEDGKNCIISCGGTLSKQSGAFRTPDWPLSYPYQDFRCEWVIDVENVTDVVIELSFDDTYGIAGKRPCPTDYVEVLDGVEHDSTSLGRYCSYVAPDPIITSSQRATVIFQATAAPGRELSTRIGVSIIYNIVRIADIPPCSIPNHGCEHICVNGMGSYHCECRDGFILDSNGKTCSVDCGGTLTNTTGTFQTPGWPHSYPQADFTCEWTIESRNHVILFQMHRIYGINGEQPCPEDHLEFFDVLESGGRSLGRYCELNAPLPIVVFTGDAKVVFRGTVDPHRPRDRKGVRVTYTLLAIG